MSKIDLGKYDPSKECLIFLEKRIESINYRGNQFSQHNRYNRDIVKTMLEEMYNIVGTDLMQIRNADLSKRPYNVEGEENYAQYVTNVNKKVGRGTQDSIRKNLFVDFARMGFIKRYSKNKKENPIYGNSKTLYVSISELGKQLILSKDNIFKENMIYTRGIDSLLQGIIDDFLLIVLDLKKITADEYTFFVSYLNLKLDDVYYSKDTIIDLVKEYRSLSRHTKEGIKNEIQQYCNPDNFEGDKTNKRDYGNWTNETQQVFMLLNQTAYFEVRDNTLYPRVGRDAIFEDEGKLKRSEAEKEEYFKYHKVNKKSGFELHHVVPLCWATNRNEFAILDNHKNMVYIDGYSHAKITQNNNKNVKLDFKNDDAVFTDFNNKNVWCKYNNNIVYNPDNKVEMASYNSSILNSIE